MKKVIRLTEGDLVRLVKRIVKESDKPKYTGYDYIKNKTNIDLDSIIDFDGDSYDDVDEFLNDVFPSTETYYNDFKMLYTFKDYFIMFLNILMDSFGLERPAIAMDYIDEWNHNRIN